MQTATEMLAEQIADALLLNGFGEKADRLVLYRYDDEHDLGGLSRQAIVNRITDALAGPAQNYGIEKLCAHGQNDTRYGSTATGPGVTTMQASLFIYDPADLAWAAQGMCSPILLPPTTDAADMSAIAHAGAPFPQLVSYGFCTFGGAWWEPASQTLFVSECHAEWQGEWRPVVHAFQVAC